MKLYLVRHPQTEIPAGLCYGGTDAAVRPDRLEAAAQSLIEKLPRNVLIYSSPLQRCAQLAEKLAPLIAGSVPIYDARLAEMHFGNWEMLAWDNIPRAEIDAWAADTVHYRPGGGETVLESAQRILAYAEDLRRAAVKEAIIVGHAGTIRLFLASRYEKNPERVARISAKYVHSIDFGSCVVIDYE